MLFVHLSNPSVLSTTDDFGECLYCNKSCGPLAVCLMYSRINNLMQHRERAVRSFYWIQTLNLKSASYAYCKEALPIALHGVLYNGFIKTPTKAIPAVWKKRQSCSFRKYHVTHRNRHTMFWCKDNILSSLSTLTLCPAQPVWMIDTRCCRPRPAAEQRRRESWAEQSWYLDRYWSSLLLLPQRVAENYLPLPPHSHSQRAAAFPTQTESLLRRESPRHCFWIQSMESLNI